MAGWEQLLCNLTLERHVEGEDRVLHFIESPTPQFSPPVGPFDNTLRGAMPAYSTPGQQQRPVEGSLDASNWPYNRGIRRQTTFDSARFYRRSKQTHIKTFLRPWSRPIVDEETGLGEPQDAPQGNENSGVEAFSSVEPFDIVQARWAWRDDRVEVVMLKLKDKSSTASKNDTSNHMQW